MKTTNHISCAASTSCWYTKITKSLFHTALALSLSRSVSVYLSLSLSLFLSLLSCDEQLKNQTNLPQLAAALMLHATSRRLFSAVCRLIVSQTVSPLVKVAHSPVSVSHALNLWSDRHSAQDNKPAKQISPAK